MKSVLIYLSPQASEIDPKISLGVLNDHLEENGLKTPNYYIPSRDDNNVFKGKYCDFVIPNLENKEASKLVKIINKELDFCAKAVKNIEEINLKGL